MPQREGSKKLEKLPLEAGRGSQRISDWCDMSAHQNQITDASVMERPLNKKRGAPPQPLHTYPPLWVVLQDPCITIEHDI